MVPLILSIIISQFNSDTILVKGIRGITYQAFIFQDTLYFQYKTGNKWSEPMVLDNGYVSSPSMAISSGGYLHIVWCKQGKVYYRTTFAPITKYSIKQNLNPQWSWKMAISTNEPYTEPASNPIVQLYDDKVFVTWQGPNEANDSIGEEWQRWKYVGFNELWDEPPININQNSLLFTFPLSSSISYEQYQVKRIVLLTPGNRWGHNLVCGDTDHDSLNELILSNDESGLYSLQVWEYRPTNRYELVWMAVGGQPSPPGGILVGNFAPNDIGDIDKDGLPDLVGKNTEYYYNDYFHTLVSTQESPSSSSFPESLSWYQRYSSNAAEAAPFYYTGDLDQDGNDEINFVAQQSGYTYIFENVGNDSNVIVWRRFQVGACSFAYGDFDLDDRREFVTANLGSAGITSVYENVAPDSYELVYQDSVHRPNGSDVFSGKDLDGDGKPEFFVSFAQYVGSTTADIYLYMWEMTGNNNYERTLLDVVRRNNFTFAGRRSRCGDLDGDGIEEMVWSTQTHLSIYKATGNNQFQRVWEWQDDHSSEIDVAYVNIYDMNNNGYNEIVFSGNGKISIFEIEAVRLINPNGGQNFLPGDSVLIQWQKFYPPRCDSFSLSYTTDNGITYQPILNSIPATESTYYWIVPNTPSESCRVKVTAYGPGTQFDESDALFTIQPSGLAETQVIDQPLRLEIKPNPFKTKTTIRLNRIPNEELTLKIYNNAGAIVKTFVLKTNNQSALGGLKTIIWDGKDKNDKSLPSGVYILQCDSKELKMTQKLVIEK